MQIVHLKRALDRAQVVTRPPAATPPLSKVDFATADPKSLVSFRCNLCGKANSVRLASLDRETPSCDGCTSTVRFRAIADLVVTELLGTDLRLDEAPVRKDLVGIGLSDSDTYAFPLAEKFDYTNTYYHCEPLLDITNPPADMAGRFDFLISSDVFEHVVPPVSRAFVNARRLLKPGGVFIFTVPFRNNGETVEHFPELFDFQVEETNGRWTLHNRTADGRSQTFSDLVFHGGPGETLEMRMFTLDGLKREFAQAGFRDVRFVPEPCLQHGIVWPVPWSVPIVARA
jgi:SAM-dependent methyltransferase